MEIALGQLGFAIIVYLNIYAELRFLVSSYVIYMCMYRLAKEKTSEVVTLSLLSNIILCFLIAYASYLHIVTETDPTGIT